MLCPFVPLGCLLSKVLTTGRSAVVKGGLLKSSYTIDPSGKCDPRFLRWRKRYRLSYETTEEEKQNAQGGGGPHSPAPLDLEAIG